MANTMLLSDLLNKYYDSLEKMVNDLSLKCTGGEETTVCFPSGKVTIKLK